VAPAPAYARHWLRDQRDLVPAFVAEFAARNGARNLTLFVIGAVGGLAAVGSIRAAQVLFGPLNVILLSIPLLAVPEAARLLVRDEARLGSFVERLTLGLSALAGIFGLAALLLPESVGSDLFGATWPDARTVLVPQAVFLASVGATSGQLVGLRALAAATESLTARLLVAPLTVCAGTVGAMTGGASGAMWGIALANWVGVVIWHRQFWRLYRARSEAASPRLGDGGGVGDGDVRRDLVDRAEEVGEAVELRP
jgi:O-antigen/teichoic acid export membrane protein